MLEQNIAYTTQEMASLLDLTDRAVSIRAKREGWQGMKRSGRGGGYAWLVVSMPSATREQLARAIGYGAGAALPGTQAFPASAPDLPVAVRVTNAPAPAASPVPTASLATPALNLTNTALPANATSSVAVTTPSALSAASERERSVALARLAFVHAVLRMVPAIGKEKAIRQLVQASAVNALAPHLASLVKVASAAPRDGATLTRRTLYRWLSDYEFGGEAALLPQFRKPDMTVPDWAPLFLKLYQGPQNKTVTHVYREFHEAMTASGAAKIPSIHAVRRCLDKISVADREAGRVTGNALLKLRPHQRRLTDHMCPTDCYTGDGTTFDAEVSHPYSGIPFKPEVWATLDVATRRCVGVSAGFAESGLVVLDSLVMACCSGGIPALYYSDKGPGNIHNMLTNEWTGVFARLGIEPTNSIPGRPQGRGLMERGVRTLWVECAKEFATYTGSDMDKDAAKKVFKLTRKELKAATTPQKRLLPSWADFLCAIEERVLLYNATPHRKLPKFMDDNGKYRHYSPDEYWQTFIDEGFEPVRVSGMCRDELFLPAEKRVVRNGWVQFYEQKYFAQNLAPFHGSTVEVRYNPRDAREIYIYTLRGERVCVATVDGNAKPYFPQSRIEAAIEVRNRKAVERLEAQAQKVIPGATIELPDNLPRTLVVDSTRGSAQAANPVQTATSASSSRSAPRAESAALIDVTPTRPARPAMFPSRHERYCWLMRNPDQQNPADKTFLAEYAQSDEYADLAERYIAEGIAYFGNTFRQTA